MRSLTFSNILNTNTFTPAAAAVSATSFPVRSKYFWDTHEQPLFSCQHTLKCSPFRRHTKCLSGLNWHIMISSVHGLP